MDDFNLDKLEAYAVMFDEGMTGLEQRMFLVFMLTRAVQLMGPAEVQEVLEKILDDPPFHAHDCTCEADEEEDDEDVITDEKSSDEMTTEEFKMKLRKILNLDPPNESDDDEWSEVIH